MRALVTINVVQCELLDDWDQRCVTSVLRWDRGQGSLTLEQTAETGDSKGRLDGRVTYQVWITSVDSE